MPAALLPSEKPCGPSHPPPKAHQGRGEKTSQGENRKPSVLSPGPGLASPLNAGAPQTPGFSLVEGHRASLWGQLPTSYLPITLPALVMPLAPRTHLLPPVPSLHQHRLLGGSSGETHGPTRLLWDLDALFQGVPPNKSIYDVWVSHPRDLATPAQAGCSPGTACDAPRVGAAPLPPLGLLRETKVCVTPWQPEMTPTTASPHVYWLPQERYGPAGHHQALVVSPVSPY